MNTDKLDNMFDNLKHDLDIEVPNSGHQERFLEKLNRQNSETTISKSQSTNYWRPLLAVAASLVICLGLFGVFNQESEIMDLASVSPELSKTQDFFTVTLTSELNRLEQERSPETELIINDALKQITHLENEYNSLKSDLNVSGNDKRVIYAMISNFQNRVDLLQNVLIHIEATKNNKTELTNQQSI